MSPRSGTPVKLLGREDASVDWYNLEKSKRVKPFRCGEFDACIEKAEASQGVAIKKREKYARREDAILHALELEKQHLEKQRQKYRTNSNTLSHKYSGNLKREINSCSSSGLHMRDNEARDQSGPVNSLAQSQTRRVDLHSEELRQSMRFHVQKGKHDRQINSEDDNSELLPCMRGLPDFGFHMALSKRKDPSSASCESSQAALFDNHVTDIPDCGYSIGSVADTYGVKNSFGVKRKRSHSASMEESPVKRRDRRRPLVQVLQNSTKLPAKTLQGNCEQTSALGQEEKEQIGATRHAHVGRCVYLPTNPSDCLDYTGHSSDKMQMSPTESGFINGPHQPDLLAEEDASSGLIGEDETCSSEGDYLVADLDEEAALHQENSEGHASGDVSVLGDQEKLGRVSDNYDMSLSGYKVHNLSSDRAVGTSDIGVSKWHLKGKRNIRHLARRPIEAFDRKDSVMSSDNCSGYLNGSIEKKQCIFKRGWDRVSGQGFYRKDEEPDFAYDDDEFFGKDSRSIGFGKHNYPFMLKAASQDHVIQDINASDEGSHEIFPSVWEASEPSHLAQSAYWEESDRLLDARFACPFNAEMVPRLVDVNLKVQASYQGEHVPLVSLMSRLNGKAIIGHPVHIDILEDGSSDFLCPRNHSGVNATAVDEPAAPTAWRTGRRSAMQRVPRPHLAPSAEGEKVELISYSGRESKSSFKKLYAAPTPWVRLMKRSSNHRLPASGKLHKKLPKKEGLSSQKTRMLSSIASAQKHSRVNASAKHGRKEGNVLDGLIKAGSTVPPVTCVPVKVVFTRILEVVGRPPSSSMTVRSLLHSSVERTSS